MCRGTTEIGSIGARPSPSIDGLGNEPGQATRSTVTHSRVLFSESLLHPLRVRMLAAAHPFVFGALQGPLVCLPRFENGEFLLCRNVCCIHAFHGSPKSTR